VLAVILALLLPAAASAQKPESKSEALAVELAKLLDAQKLDSFAARADDGYVGALYFPGSQLLVVSARYSAPERMDYLLSQKSYRDIYIDLNSAAERQSKIFISDLGADGLHFEREDNEPFDTVDVQGSTVDFDGDWDKAKISEDEYMKRFQSTDERYSSMLQALIGALKKPS
jgi:hypothetical protein